MKELFARVEDNKVLEVNLNKEHITNRDKGQKFLPILVGTMPDETEDIAYTPTYTITQDGRFVVMGWKATERKATNKAKFIASQQVKKQREIESRVSMLIQEKVDAYNKANMLSFKDIYTCALYRTVNGYTHQAFCIAIWNWQTSVWEYLRQELEKVLSNARTEPTIEELVDEININVPLVY